MKLTTKQIQKIIKEELNNVLYENRKGLPKGISVDSLPKKIIDALKAQKLESSFFATKKLEPLDLARINHLFKFFLRGDQYEARYAKKWIQSLYKDFPEFKKIVDSDRSLSLALNPPRSARGANLRGANLRGANLRGANLSGEDLSETYLSKANLVKADLSKADLSDADLRWAFLSHANLSEANLRGANLQNASLTFADLSGADLFGADLSDADLEGADLRKANLTFANLRGAYLRGADLSGADLREAFYSRLTRWPEGFDPIKAGATRAG